MSKLDMWGKSIPERGNSQWKGCACHGLASMVEKRIVGDEAIGAISLMTFMSL